jgi:hypothetical protein
VQPPLSIRVVQVERRRFAAQHSLGSPEGLVVLSPPAALAEGLRVAGPASAAARRA